MQNECLKLSKSSERIGEATFGTPTNGTAQSTRIQAAVNKHLETRTLSIKHNISTKISAYPTTNANEAIVIEEYLNAQKSVVINTDTLA